MLDTESRIFTQRASRFLRGKLEFLRQEYGAESREYYALARQYLLDPRETEVDYKAERGRHYEAELLEDSDGLPLRGVERLYRRVALIEPTTTCTCHCRWCLRAQYPRTTLKKEELTRAARYLGNDQNRDDLREVLITGGDPLLFPDLMEATIDSIVEYAPNIETVRIGSKLPAQDPGKVDDELLSILGKYPHLRMELGTHINHPMELWDETRDAYKRLQDIGFRIYNQQVLLAGVNNDLDTLVELYDSFRELGIEAHYMFHCIPMRGMSHHRTSVEDGLELIKGLTCSGRISGRCKPMYTAMTDIGKVTLYEGVILDRKEVMILLQTKYLESERLRWNPSWRRPDSVSVDDDGYLRVWYRDGEVHNEGWPTTYFF